MQQKTNKLYTVLSTTLMVFALTNAYYQLYVLPSYAVSPTNFYMCETPSCAIGYNSTNIYIVNSTTNAYIDLPLFVQKIDTGEGLNELFDMNQNLQTSDTVTFFTLNTGFGNNELYAMNQDVETSDNVTFNQVTVGTNILKTINELRATNFNGVTNFQNYAVTNLGNADNDFGATNTLIETTFLGDIDIQNNLMKNMKLGTDINLNGYGLKGFNTFNDYIYPAGANGWNFITSDGAGSYHVRVTIGREATVSNMTFNNINLIPSINNTLVIGHQNLRWANIYATILTSKSQVTGANYENEITANPDEVFENGDVVCLKSLWIFTKCSKDYTFLLSTVEFLGEHGIVGYKNVTKYRLIEQTEVYLQNVTDKDGKTYLTKQIRTVTENIIEKQEITLSDNKLKEILVTKTVPKMINQSYVVSEPVFGEVDKHLYLVKDRPTTVKICGNIQKGQFLVAGLDGCANGVNVLDIGQRSLGLAVEDSITDKVSALVGW